MADAIGLGYLIGMTGAVAFGAIVPVLPTGAAVSVGAALAGHNPLLVAVVIAFGALGAYIGDISTYALLRFASTPLLSRVRWLNTGHSADTLAALRRRVEEHELPVLLTSRLIPGGRVPVLLAVALGGYSWRRFALADIAAASLWATFYAAIGLIGRAVFPEPWQAAVAAIVLVGAVTLANAAWARRHPPPAMPAPTEPDTGTTAS